MTKLRGHRPCLDITLDEDLFQLQLLYQLDCARSATVNSHQVQEHIHYSKTDMSYLGRESSQSEPSLMTWGPDP